MLGAVFARTYQKSGSTILLTIQKKTVKTEKASEVEWKVTTLK